MSIRDHMCSNYTTTIYEVRVLVYIHPAEVNHIPGEWSILGIQCYSLLFSYIISFRSSIYVVLRLAPCDSISEYLGFNLTVKIKYMRTLEQQKLRQGWRMTDICLQPMDNPWFCKWWYGVHIYVHIHSVKWMAKAVLGNDSVNTL
jgi:hypothetical protein